MCFVHLEEAIIAEKKTILSNNSYKTVVNLFVVVGPLTIEQTIRLL